MIPECVPDVINLKTFENPGENKNCNRCLEIRYEYRINNPDKVKETRGTKYFCQVCDYDIQWCHKAEHKKKHFIRKKNENKLTQKNLKMMTDQTGYILTMREEQFIAVLIVNVLKFYLIIGDHIRREAHMHNKAGKLPFRRT